MKFLKGISIFLLAQCILIGGIWLGMNIQRYFYPGQGTGPITNGFAKQPSETEYVDVDDSHIIIPDVFILLVEDNFIVVYASDRSTPKLHTTIYVPFLPEKLQQELMNGKQIRGEKELNDFLESYTS